MKNGGSSEMQRDEERMSLDEFRQAARIWIAANLEREDENAGGRWWQGESAHTAEHLAQQRQLQSRLFEGGYAGITVPTEYGGRGLTREHEEVFLEEARGHTLPDFGWATAPMFNVCLPTLLQHGSPEFLASHVPRILNGDEVWVQFYSEPDAGSDLAGIRTRAARDGESWVLTGAKTWTTAADIADWGMCLARTNWDVPKHKGLTWFAVPTSAPGVTVNPIAEVNGESNFCEVLLDQVVLSVGEVIGELERGWEVSRTMLVFERNQPSPLQSAGTKESNLTDYSAGRSSADLGFAPDLVALARRVDRLDDPVVRQMVARAYIDEVAKHALSVRIGARLREEGLNPGVAAYVKLAAGTCAPARARIGMEIGGTSVRLWAADDADAQQLSDAYLMGRVFSIAGGTNEMQRNAIGEHALGLPREPSFDSVKPFNQVLREAVAWDGRVG